MGARESVIESPHLGAALTKQMLPVIDKSQSDSGGEEWRDRERGGGRPTDREKSETQ